MSYPHPVLGNGDDIAGAFDVACDVAIGDVVSIECRFQLENATIQELVANGRARQLLRVSCRRTYLRQSFESSQPAMQVVLAADSLRGQVLIEPLVAAVEDLTDYRPEGLHGDYGTATFRVARGQILCVGPVSSFHVEKDFDPLRNPVSSIIKLEMGTEDQGPVEVDYDSDQITVRLSRGDWRRYQATKRVVPSVLLALIAFPVLVEAVRKCAAGGDESDWREHMWYTRLTEAVAAQGLSDITDPVQVTQALLQLPMARALVELDEGLHQEDD